MTWTGMLTVDKVTKHKDGTYTVSASAEKGEPIKVRYPHGQESEMPPVTSNTEGSVKTVELSLTVEGDVFIEAGDLLNVSGHFDRSNMIKKTE